MKEPDALNFIEGNGDWLKFNQAVSDNTGIKYGSLWKENAAQNRKRVRHEGWAAEKLQDKHDGQTAVMLGASPAIKSQLGRLKELQKDKDFVLIGITSGLRNMLNNGIRPRYVMIADADPAMSRFWDGMDMKQTRNITLIANICTHPSMLAKWQGPIKFLAIYTAIDELDRQLRKDFGNINGCGAMFPALSSQYNIGAAVARLVLGCPVTIFTGLELGFPTKESPYYADRKDVKDKWDRFPHPDIFGGVYYTNYMLFALKLALEDFLGKISKAGWYFNATQAGIFGVSKRYRNTPWIWQFDLETAITQASAIMKTGQPVYAPKKYGGYLP